MYLLSDGFDHYVGKEAPAASIKRYLEDASYEVANETDATLKVVDGTDEGSLGLRLSIASGTATPVSIKRTLVSTADLCVFGFGFRGTGERLRMARINDSVDIEWDPVTGKIKVGAELGANVIILNAWWYIEVEVDSANEEIRVWANDTLQLTAPYTPTAPGSYSIEWGGANDRTGTIEIDDFAVVDSAPGQNTSRIGPVSIITRAPTADATPNEWALVGSASATHWPIVSQLDPGRPNAPYLQANVEGRTDMFSSNTVLPNANQVFAVSLVSYARKGDLDDRAIGMKIKTADGETEAQASLTETYKYHTTVFEQAPGALPWTQSRVEASEFGIVAR